MYELVSFVLRGRIRHKILVALVKPKTPTQLAREIKTHQSTTSRALNSLEEKGLVNCLTPKEKDELIVGKYRFHFKFQYQRKNGMKILSYYNDKLGKKKDVPFYFRGRLRMRDKMEKPESKEVYRLRKCTVGPVIGNIKQNLGFREFLLKGLERVKIEMNLMSIAHNVQKIWKLRADRDC